VETYSHRLGCGGDFFGKVQLEISEKVRKYQDIPDFSRIAQFFLKNMLNGEHDLSCLVESCRKDICDNLQMAYRIRQSSGKKHLQSSIHGGSICALVS